MRNRFYAFVLHSKILMHQLYQLGIFNLYVVLLRKLLFNVLNRTQVLIILLHINDVFAYCFLFLFSPYHLLRQLFQKLWASSAGLHQVRNTRRCDSMFFSNFLIGFQLKQYLMNDFNFLRESKISPFASTFSTIDRNWISIFRWRYLVSIITSVCSTFSYLFAMVGAMFLPF